jgi:hemolysin III
MQHAPPRPAERDRATRPRRLAAIRRLREPDNGLTHLAGAALALAACGALLTLALGTGSPRHVVAFAVFGASLVGLYTASALYHSLRLGPRGVARLRRLDHMAIFVLIAGSYTPFCLVAFHGGWRWGLLAAIWGLAAGGVALKIGWMHAPAWRSFVVYIAMGWMAVLAIPAFLATVPLAGLAWIAAGGLVYTIGAAVFALQRPRLYPGVFGSHALWHLLVIAGSACHVWAVARYLTPLA